MTTRIESSITSASIAPRRATTRVRVATAHPDARPSAVIHVLFAGLCAVLVMLAARQASAELRLFELDIATSTLEIDTASSSVIVNVLGTDYPIGISTQVGAVAGVEGYVMPYGEVSDGLKTSLLGPLLANVTSDSIQLMSETTEVGLAPSGIWAPGPLGDELTRTEGQAAAHLLGLDGFDLIGNFALRDTALQPTSPPISLLAAAGGGAADPLDQTQTFDTTSIDVEVLEGTADFEYASLLLSGVEHLSLAGIVNSGFGGTGTLVRHDDGTLDLEIPIEIRVSETIEFLGGFTEIEMVLGGKLVAHSAPIGPIPGDANLDGIVDGADYTIWADNYLLSPADFGDGDFNGDDIVDGADYTIWADHFGESLGPDETMVMQMNQLTGGGATAAACGLGFEAVLALPLLVLTRRRSTTRRRALRGADADAPDGRSISRAQAPARQNAAYPQRDRIVDSAR